MNNMWFFYNVVQMVIVFILQCFVIINMSKRLLAHILISVMTYVL